MRLCGERYVSADFEVIDWGAMLLYSLAYAGPARRGQPVQWRYTVLHYPAIRTALTAGGALAIFALPVAATAQGGATQGSAAPSQPLTRTVLANQIDGNFRAMDSNNDKTLTAAEIEAAQKVQAAKVQASLAQRVEAEFARLDSNKDGQLTLAEFRAATPTTRIKPAAELLAQFDRNKDGKVTLEEHRAVPLANFDRLDSNKDGTISPQEQTAARARR